VSTNHLWQLRPYSYADLLLLLAAAGADTGEAIGASLLWFGFLIHLEWRHHDVGRLPWPAWAWLVPWMGGAIILATPLIIPFFALAALYALKKRFAVISATSPLLNGALKVALLLPLGGISGALLAVVFFAATARNFAGDLRDAAKDAAEGVATVPVLLGYTKATPYVYPLSLGATSALWTIWGNLPLWALATAWAVELATYRLTPR